MMTKVAQLGGEPDNGQVLSVCIAQDIILSQYLNDTGREIIYLLHSEAPTCFIADGSLIFQH